MSDALHLQARVARIVRRRRVVLAAVVCALRDVQAQDHLLAQLGPALTPAAWRAIIATLEQQDAGLADAVADCRAISPAPSDTLRFEPDPAHPGSLRPISQSLDHHA